MIKADYTDRSLVIEILTKAYDKNETINETIMQDKNRNARLHKLMKYSFFLCKQFGKVYLSDDKQAVALILFPEKKRTTLKTIGWDIQFLFTISGFSKSLKALSRENAVRKAHPTGPIYHLWYLATDPLHAGKGIGGALMKDLIGDAEAKNRILCVESRMEQNTSWYQKLGFSIYKELIHEDRKWSCMKIAPGKE
ncbi:acetyltransferase (GNAT) family protein [Chitinophaga niastensis]|uniref:Acetyltransferase (GNAT) family protein n=1 Tax=Chitinophaga niastensis TaxID=536980 RepID=A0A2P8HEK9_CHINA|nr:GNAT family N-acetyltransferase [Chitinophaga niastensis]PSL44634.1 acetyltransferase (GNAT) family protein [Chitinophaga niastensis]